MSSNSERSSRLTPDGKFPNGVSVVSVIRFIRAYDYEAHIDDVANYYGLEAEDVAAAISFHSRHFDWVHPLVLEGER